MIVSVNQPAYLPWLGYFHRIAVSDLHVVFDHVQFAKNSFTNRNRIRTAAGSAWLTVPLATRGRFGALAIDELEIAPDPRWAQKHWDTIRFNYAKAPYFRDHAPFFEDVYRRPWGRLNPLMREITGYLLKAFGISTPLVYSSEIGPLDGQKSALVLEVCRKAGASLYLSGTLGRNYLDEGSFRAAGIRLAYQDYRHPQYKQVFKGFESYMAAIDLLFNCGPQSLEILLGGNPSREQYTEARVV